MRRILKKIMIIGLSIILLYSLFIVEESIRISRGGVKPLIVLEEEYINGETDEKLFSNLNL